MIPILIVDDDPVNISILQDLLKSVGESCFGGGGVEGWWHSYPKPCPYTPNPSLCPLNPETLHPAPETLHPTPCP